jgi:hypothetical protein
MAQNDVTTLLDPFGPELRKAAQGSPNEARVAVAVHWPQIEKALDSGFTISAIYRVLSKAGVVGVTLRSFTRQVKARREGARGSRTAAKAAEPEVSPAVAAGGGSPSPDASAPAGPERSEPAEKRPAIPDRPWRKGPHVPPDPNAIFRPRDPLADE